mmetsp:Transcript_15965/g.24311  ORF Transcript_15965/g.24311 Transcript_15965/m.24311 type:complete len:130 (+) Transcript_15965:67-456(+)
MNRKKRSKSKSCVVFVGFLLLATMSEQQRRSCPSSEILSRWETIKYNNNSTGVNADTFVTQTAGEHQVFVSLNLSANQSILVEVQGTKERKMAIGCQTKPNTKQTNYFVETDCIEETFTVAGIPFILQN